MHKVRNVRERFSLLAMDFSSASVRGSASFRFRYAFVASLACAEGGILFNRLCDGGAPVLPVVDDEIGFLKIHFQKAKPVRVDRLEADFAFI